MSVVVPVHDPDPRLLGLALRSVEEQLYPDWELCLVDDALARSAGWRLLSTFAARRPGRTRLRRLAKPAHIAGATNAALALATGEYVAFLDHDDELTPDALLEVVAAMQDDPAPDIVYSDHDVLGRDGQRRYPSFKPDWCPELLLSYMYLGHLKVYRTELVRAAGGLREGFEGSADYDLALRLAERTDSHPPRAPHPVPLARGARLHGGGDPRNKPQSFEAGRERCRRRWSGAGSRAPRARRTSPPGGHRRLQDRFRGHGAHTRHHHHPHPRPPGPAAPVRPRASRSGPRTRPGSC